MSRRRVIRPLPIDYLATHPAVVRLPSAGFGALMRLVIHFWITECVPLPKSNDELRLIARCHKPTWALHREEIKQAVAEILPRILEDAASRQANSDRLKAWRLKGASTKQLRSLEKKMARSMPAHLAAPRLGEEAKREERRAGAAPENGGGFRDV